MKNFSMPDQISQTLELDELERLKHSLEENVYMPMLHVGGSRKFKFANMASLHRRI